MCWVSRSITNDDGLNNRPTFAQLGIASLDNLYETVMSSSNTPVWAFPKIGSSMPLDILAIQQIYGANMSYHTGNDSYQLTGSYRCTIWDAGGIDTLDASGCPGAMIDLRPGNLSYSASPASAYTASTAIAYGVTIENAIGSPANDTIIGNDADNTIDGGPCFCARTLRRKGLVR